MSGDKSFGMSLSVTYNFYRTAFSTVKREKWFFSFPLGDLGVLGGYILITQNQSDCKALP